VNANLTRLIEAAPDLYEQLEAAYMFLADAALNSRTLDYEKCKPMLDAQWAVLKRIKGEIKSGS
jgi:hypothetical protein